MRRQILTLLIFILPLFAGAQKQWNNWAFGDSAGLNFSSGIASFDLNFVLSSIEPSASISDSNGNLLFYAGPSSYSTQNSHDSIRIWNKNHQIMPNGTQIMGWTSCTQGTAIIPEPGSNFNYYIFSINKFNDLYYSKVNMQLNGGLGDVYLKNIALDTITWHSEKMNAVKHGNGRDWWLLLHNLSYEFIRYLITPSGISGPFYQSIGSSFGIFPFFYVSQGQLKFSPDGRKLFVAGLTATADLYNFDRCTGLLSSWVYLGDSLFNDSISFLGDNRVFYGCSFSPNGEVLYLSSDDSLFQYDLTASNIAFSKTLIFYTGCPDTCWIGQHQLGPDGKIYIANCKKNCFYNDPHSSINENISYIENPNTVGVGCNFTYLFINLGGRRSYWGLPNLPHYELGSWAGSACDTLSVGIAESNDEIRIFISPNPAQDVIKIQSSVQFYAVEFVLYDATGRKALEKKINKNASISVSHLQPGLYFYRVKDKDGKTVGGKIVIGE